jgi:hypothetical protein
MEKTRSTDEAMMVLEQYRAGLIKLGRIVAFDIAKKEGVVHSRRVRDAIAAMGLLNQPDLNDFWLGAVFRHKAFEWTGDHHVYSDESRNIHERTIKIWTLVPGATL